MHDSFIKSLSFLPVLSGLLLVIPSCGMTDTTRPTSERPSAFETDFRSLAKKAIPSIVSIKVQGQKKSTVFGKELPQDLDFFGGNDLWRFFGSPRNQTEQPFEGQGSGVVVSADGHILTNSHVVHDTNKIKVQLNDGREFDAKLVGEDTNSDVALIKIEATDLPYLTLGDSSKMEVGDWVAAIGNPLGLQATLTHGIVSAKGRNNLDIAKLEDFIQTDAPIYKGNSGGALLNLAGEVIGINTAIATTSNYGYVGIGFAIPSNIAKQVMEELLSTGKVTRGFLGVTLQPIDYELAQAFGLKKVEGALVTQIIKGAAADKAGLQVEDIIVKLDGTPVDGATALRNAILMKKPGTKTVLTVIRNDQTIMVPLEIGLYSEEELAATKKTNLGIEVGALTPEIATSLGYIDEKGVVITKVNPGTPAAQAGLKKGALILSVNRQKIENVEQFETALKNTAKDKPVLLQLKMGERYVYVSIQVG